MSKKSMSNVPKELRMVRGFAIFYFMTRGVEFLLSRVMPGPLAAILAFVAVTALVIYRLHGL